MRLAAALLLCVAARADLRLLVHDRQGNFLREAAAVARTGGYAYAPREALYGAATAVLLDGKGAIHLVQWVSGDDPDLGVVELFAGAQLPAGPAGSTDENPARLESAAHETHIAAVKEAGSAGIVGRLDCQHDHPVSAPLYDAHGLLAGWHVTRKVDGKLLSFAIPLRRLELASRTVHVDVDEWGLKHDAAREASYQRALGYFWADDFDGALFYFREAAQQDSANARAWLHIGFAEGKQGRTREKVACLKRAIELEPDLEAAHFYLGLQFLMNGEYESAETERDELRRLQSPYAIRLDNLIKAIHVDHVEKTPKGNRPVHRTRRPLTGV